MDHHDTHMACTLPYKMRACRWLVAVTATSCGRHRASAGSPTNAFINFFATPYRSASRTSAVVRCSPAGASGGIACASSSSAGNRPKTAAMSMDGDGGVRQSWCGHELLNTVTTDWVEDNLGNPEVRYGTVSFFLFCGDVYRRTDADQRFTNVCVYFCICSVLM